MLRLDQVQTATLLNEPESGMGYQLVEATLRDNKIETGVAYMEFTEAVALSAETGNEVALPLAEYA